jgi:disulfide bond formation protein DsbB
MLTKSDTQARSLALAIPAVLLGGAYISEYVFGLFPCEMCWWQRYAHFAALALALGSFVVPPPRVWVALAAAAIAVSGLIGAFHAGVEYGWWEGITTCATPVAGTGGDVLDAILAAPIVRCDVAPWTLAGISLAGFNFIISVLSAIAIWALLAKEDA